MEPQILVVDDDDAAREGLVEVLSEDYRSVESAADGQKAIDMIRSGAFRPDLILLDLRMPVMDGVSFLQHRAVDPSLGAAQVIVLTSETSLLPDLAEMVAAVLPKPVPLARLLEIIDTICDEPGVQRTNLRSMRLARGTGSLPPAGRDRRRHRASQV